VAKTHKSKPKSKSEENLNRQSALKTARACERHSAQLSYIHPAQNSSDNLLCYFPNNHHGLDVVYWSGGESGVGKVADFRPISRYISEKGTRWGQVTTEN